MKCFISNEVADNLLVGLRSATTNQPVQYVLHFLFGKGAAVEQNLTYGKNFAIRKVQFTRDYTG